MKSCVFFWCKHKEVMNDGNISGNFYIDGCADTEKYESGAYVDAAANLTADDVKSGKLAYDMNTLLGGEFFFQTIGTNAAPTTDKSQKSVKLVNGKYTNESGTTPVTPTAPATGDGTPVYIIAAVLAIMTMITVIVTGKKKSKAE